MSAELLWWAGALLAAIPAVSALVAAAITADRGEGGRALAERRRYERRVAAYHAAAEQPGGSSHHGSGPVGFSRPPLSIEQLRERAIDTATGLYALDQLTVEELETSVEQILTGVLDPELRRGAGRTGSPLPLFRAPRMEWIVR